ncbi:MAG: winged helix-turn-helix domain-containing protein [Patescibacteria group bacterium]
MLESIFGSATRVKMLNLLLLAADQRFEPARLARDLDLPANSVRHELDNLVRFGLLSEEKVLKKRYFSVKADFILYPEIKALFAKAQILSSQKFIFGLQKISQPKFLALTGIFTNYPEAQTDLLVVGNVRRPAFLKLMKELEHDLGREINFTIMTEKEFLYREEIMDIFLYNILSGKTLVLIDNLHPTGDQAQKR